MRRRGRFGTYPFATALTDERDWAALQKMANAGQSIRPATLKLVLNQGISVTGVPFTLSGAGMETSSLFWPISAVSRGISISKTISAQPALIENVSLINDEGSSLSAQPTGVAIGYVNNHTGADAIIDGTYPNLTVRNVLFIRGVPNDPQYPYNGWRIGVYGKQLSYVTCECVTFFGCVGAGPDLPNSLPNGSYTGFLFEADSINQSSAVHIIRCMVIWSNYGVVVHWVEAPRVELTDFVNVNTGVYYDGGPYRTGPCVVRDCHMNTMVAAVNYLSCSWADINNNIIFQNQNTNAASYGITASNTQKGNIRGNKFYKAGPTSAQFTCVNLSGQVTTTTVENNKFEGEIGVYVAGDTTGAILDNDGTNVTSSFISGDSSGMMVRGYVGIKQNWNNNGINTSVGEKFMMSGTLLIDAEASGAPLLLNRTGAGNLAVVYNSFSALWIASIAGNGVQFGRSSDYNGFFGATPVQKPTVTGSKGGNAALGSLLSALSNLGLIADSSS